MRRVLVALTAAVVLCLSFGDGAQARCGVACLNHRVAQLSNGLTRAEKKISSLSRTVSQQEQTIAGQQQALGALGVVGKKVDALYECLFEVPVTQFGEPGSPFGYLFQFENESKELETEPTSAIDVPYEGEPVGAWFLIDGCNSVETAGVKAAGALAPPAPDLPALRRPQVRRLP
jgi:uncharacterized coiled-coil protein SlyX